MRDRTMKKPTSRRSNSGTRASKKDLPVRKSKDVKGGVTAGLPKSGTTTKTWANDDEAPKETITFTYGA